MKIRTTLFLLLCTLSLHVYATHTFGGELTYKYLGSFTPNTARYEVTLTMYEDCLHGLSEAISQDNPEYINFFDSAGNSLYGPYAYDSMMRISLTLIDSSSQDVCPHSPLFNKFAPEVCLQKSVFRKAFDLPIIHTPGARYTAVVQRCCLNSSIVNINNPATFGITFSATIPADTEKNNSAVFKNDPVYFVRINRPMNISAAAIDTDGDSLSYEFCTAYAGGSNMDAKPEPAPPPFTAVTYTPPYSYSYPMTGSPAITLDPATGIISGTPTVLGRYLVTVCCHEWRNGVHINTISREVQLIVTDCAPDNTAVPLLSAAQGSLKIYANPSASSVKVGFMEGAGSIVVTDVFGRTMYRSYLSTHQNLVELPTGTWSTGMYIATLIYPGMGKVSTKFVVE